MELRADVKEKDQLLKETQDLVKAAGQRSEEFKQLCGDLADQKKQLQVVKSRLEAAEVARDYLRARACKLRRSTRPLGRICKACAHWIRRGRR